jgi:FkbM family methyltransferase
VAIENNKSKLSLHNTTFHKARAQRHLLNCRWAEGWLDYELRSSKLKWIQALDKIEQWDGRTTSVDCGCQQTKFEDSMGCSICQGERKIRKKLLVIGELGLEAQLFFSRYLPEVIKCQFDRVILYTLPELSRFFECFGIPLITSDVELKSLLNSEMAPDCWVSLPSLPHILAITQPIPPTKRTIDYNKTKIYLRPGIMRIGIAWRYDQEKANHNVAGLPITVLQSLLKSGHEFYGLQSGLDLEYSNLFDLQSHCHDLLDLSIEINNLDLIITVDNAIAHLAGILNKKTWLLLEDSHKWYWSNTGNRNDWYPSIEIFRVGSYTEHNSIIKQIIDELSQCKSNIEERVSDTRTHNRYNIEISRTLIKKHCKYGSISFYSTDHYIGRSLDLYGEYSEGEVSLFRRIISKGDVVIEVGSNIGALTLPLSHIVGNEGLVHAFEPQLDIFEILKSNLTDRENVLIWNSALASSRIPFTYLAAQHDKICNTGSCEMITLHESDGSNASLTQTLDNLFWDVLVALIKIDVEGMELDVLQGANHILMRCRPLLYVEDDRANKSAELHSWLDLNDYHVYRHLPTLYNPRNYRNYRVNVFGDIVSSNLLCIPKERLEFQHITSQLEIIPPKG